MTSNVVKNHFNNIFRFLLKDDNKKKKYEEEENKRFMLNHKVKRIRKTVENLEFCACFLKETKKEYFKACPHVESSRSQ